MTVAGSAVRSLRLSPWVLAIEARWKAMRRRRQWGSRARERGHCPLCGRDGAFVVGDSVVGDSGAGNPRESPLCLHCGSAPRQRALAKVVAALGFGRGTIVHESSPSLASWCWLRRLGAAATCSHWFATGSPGARVGAFHDVDLRTQPFAAASFDLVLTQDVMEHVPSPLRAFAEIQRTLRANGCHVFTVPRQRDAATVTRAVERDGDVVQTLPPVYHGNPIAAKGSLVTTDWGRDLEAVLAADANVHCASIDVVDRALVIPHAVEVFVAAASSAELASRLAAWQRAGVTAPR
jgi:SAM-dependent methyltransferase